MTDERRSYDVDLVRERTDILALVGQYVTLKKQGGRHVGLCPFHQEKTPSFGVNPERGLWHCFGCGKGGDAFAFLMQLEHLDFPEALERLAERAGVPPTVTTAVAQKRKEERDFLLEANEAAAAAFAKALGNPPGAGARTYLGKRGITPEIAARFGLGYAPAGWDTLVNHLRGRGHSLEMLEKAGLALKRSRGDGYIDRFRNRVMIPIYDRRGRVVAFGGRALTPDDQPKYLNTAETPVFQKSHTLYALNWAADAISKKGRAIVTEGYFDAIACHLAGFTEAVATLGTALGEEHVRVLRRLADKVYLVFDADSAGVNAALRSQALFREAGVDVRIVRLPEGHDPDTLLREEGGDAFERCLTDALAPVTFELDRLLLQHPPTDTESRLRLFRAAARLLQPLPGLERSAYAAWLVERMGAPGDVTTLQQAILGEVAALDRNARRQAAGAPPREEPPAPPSAPDVPLEREVLANMVQHPGYACDVILAVPAEAFTHPGYRAIFSALVRLADAGETPDARRIDDPALQPLVAGLAVRVLEPTLNPPAALLDRLREEHEKRQAQPAPIPLDDRAALEAFQRRRKEQSAHQKRRSGLDPSTGVYKGTGIPLPDNITRFARGEEPEE
jgi:DNA primase